VSRETLQHELNRRIAKAIEDYAIEHGLSNDEALNLARGLFLESGRQALQEGDA
jgi:pyrroline-5-carboxylate reductase